MFNLTLKEAFNFLPTKYLKAFKCPSSLTFNKTFPKSFQAKLNWCKHQYWKLLVLKKMIHEIELRDMIYEHDLM